MKGLTAYQTFCGMSAHYRGGAYDGWLYNFKTRVSADKYAANKAIVYQYAAIERNFPVLCDQLKFFYPAFAKAGFVKADNVRFMHTCYREYMAYVDNIVPTFSRAMEKLKSGVDNFAELFENGGTLPRIYELVDSGVIVYRDAVILFLAVPQLNNVYSNEPFVFAPWKAKIAADKKFVSLYIDADTLATLRQVVVTTFKRD